MRNSGFVSRLFKAVLVLATVGWAAAFAFGNTEPDIFTYPELVALYENEQIAPPLKEKLERLQTTPFVHNSEIGEVRPSLASSTKLGQYLRVVHWNIERGIEFEAIAAAFESEERFAAMLDRKDFPVGGERRRKILREAKLLRAADVIVLNEVDWGMKRTDYRNVAAELASRLKMNYAFGVQFVELSPVHMNQKARSLETSEKELDDVMGAENGLYKGLHGLAVLSRFRLENVRLVPFKTQPYDWYAREKEGASVLEKGKRVLSRQIFLEESVLEVRRGGRSTLFADIVDDRLPTGRITIAATHLENRSKPSGRVAQISELLASIKNIKNPVILAGDMNTSGSDLTPTSFRKEFMKRAKDPKFWVKQALGTALSIGFLENVVIGGLNFGRNHADPTVKHIPFIAPNREAKFFKTVENFRFADGGAFDFRGDEGRSTGGKEKELANSNERGSKGFVTTYQVKRPISFIGKYKLDWFFVKPADLKHPSDRDGSYVFAPHFGNTLTDINEAIHDRLSDHRPMLIDLPLAEPRFQLRKKN